MLHSCVTYKADESAWAKRIGFSGERTARVNPVHLKMKQRKSFKWTKQVMALIHNKGIVNFFSVPDHKRKLLKHTPKTDELDHGDLAYP